MSSQHTKLGNLVRIRTGKLDANANDPEGNFPFFTCAVEPLRIASYSYDCECVLVAGNGDLNVKYYSGKFDAYQRTYIIESLNPAVLNVRYLFHFLDRYLDKLRHMSIGGVIKYIKLGNLTNAEIPLLPLTEQVRIAAILDQADALRVKRREALAQLDILAQSIFIEMFGDPVTNPKGWDIVKLGDHTLKMGSGSTPTGGDAAYKESGISLIRSLNVHDGRFRYKNLAFIDDQQASKLANVKVLEDDVLLNITGASVARVCRAPKDVLPACVNQHVMIIRPKSTIDSLFLEQMLLSPAMKRSLLQIGAGATRESITKAQAEELKVLCPPISLQQTFAKRITSVAGIRASQAKSLTELDNMFASLQHRAFRGEL